MARELLHAHGDVIRCQTQFQRTKVIRTHENERATAIIDQQTLQANWKQVRGEIPQKWGN
jgi:hypothetical protein